MTFAWLDDFKHDLELRGLAPSTVYNSVRVVKSYSLWCAQEKIDDPLSQASLLKFLGYIRSSGMKPESIRKFFSRLSTYFSYLEDEGKIAANPIPRIQRRYLKTYKTSVSTRQIITIEDAGRMVRATIDTRDRAVLLVLLKTGIRRHELITIDINDVDLEEGSILLKPTPKRSNRIVFFDAETKRALVRWMTVRKDRVKRKSEPALFLNRYGTSRITSYSVWQLVISAAERVGLHDTNSDRTEDHFTPHCCRHWFTTHLIRSGMPRDYIKWLRGDAISEAIDIYNHIDPEDVRRSYLAHIPMLGV